MNDNDISQHYGISGILNSILNGLEKSGKNIDSLQPNDLSPVDEFHTRGKESTIELANLAQLESHHKVLDVGCGLGGSARYLAEEFAKGELSIFLLCFFIFFFFIFFFFLLLLIIPGILSL